MKNLNKYIINSISSIIGFICGTIMTDFKSLICGVILLSLGFTMGWVNKE